MSQAIQGQLSSGLQLVTTIVDGADIQFEGIDFALETIEKIGAQQANTEESLQRRVDSSNVTKVENSDIFAAMKSKMCLIESPKGKASGFFINEKGLLVTTFHCLPLKEFEGGDFDADLSCVEVVYNDQRYQVKFPENFNATKARALDLCLLQVKSDNLQTEYFEPLPPRHRLEEGVKTYFAGFPLTQSVPTFHKGLISSVFTKNGAQYFTIDGTVVPGNSGGPVIVVDQKNLYLAGVIFSEVADLDPDFLFLENSFEAMRKNGRIMGDSFGLLYPDGEIRSTKPLDIISRCLTVVKRNMSTGIGKAIHAQHISELLSTERETYPLTGPEQPITPAGELPVHGTLKVASVSKESTAKIPDKIFKEASEFIQRYLVSSDSKKKLYCSLWGSPGPIDVFPGEGHFDRQSPIDRAANVQIQVKNDTIATVLISDDLSKEEDDADIATVANYVVRQFVAALNYYKKHERTVVLRIDPKTPEEIEASKKSWKA